MTQKYKISELMNNEWKEFSIATCEERGIPQFADGLKPVQRFLILQGLKTARTKFDKVNAIASAIAALGYEHGDASASGALTSLAAYYGNNIPLFEGDGSFGNVLDPTPAASRYIYARLTPLFENLFKDNDLAPANPDPEVKTPLYYLPIIPMCLINGIKGIATGYAVDIPPHDPKSIIDILISKCDGKASRKKPIPKYWGFTGTVTTEEDAYVVHAVWERKGQTKVHIMDLPHGFNTAPSYDKFLHKLQEKGKIVSYEDNSRDDRFDYVITFKRGDKLDDEEVVKLLKLDSRHTWNLTTVMPTGKLHCWNKQTGIMDIVNQFYDFRLPFVATRIKNAIAKDNDELRYMKGLAKFIGAVVAKKVNFKDADEAVLLDLLINTYNIQENRAKGVLDLPMRTLTVEKIAALNEKIKTLEEELAYLKSTTPEAEYKKDLQDLQKALAKYEKDKQS